MSSGRSHASKQHRASQRRPLLRQLPQQNGRCAPKVDVSAALNRRMRLPVRNQALPYEPPEEWHEPQEQTSGYRVIVRKPGKGYRHVVTEKEIKARLARLPEELLKDLQIVQLAQMTRKKQGLPCYGMQWGQAIYLYPMEEDLTETYAVPPDPQQQVEARMYGATWQALDSGLWELQWTPQALRDFYLNNILIHELGHLVDRHNSTTADRERYAEWFAIEYGYLPTADQRTRKRKTVKRRHHGV